MPTPSGPSRSSRRRRPVVGPVLALLASLAGASAAHAARCGDDVGGRVVLCDCGDVVVSAVRLTAAHPVATRTCSGDALLVDVPPSTPAPTVDLGGQTLRGTQRGTGIRVLRGGRDGIALIGPGEVVGFDVGIAARPDAITQLSDVRATGNRSDGFRLAGTGYVLQRCEASGNGRSGFVLRGEGYRVDDSHAVDNGRDGFDVGGTDAQLAAEGRNTAGRNRRDGARVRGRRNEVDPSLAPKRGRGDRRRCPAGEVCP